MDNPYAAPSSNLTGRDSYGQDTVVSQRVADIMRRTQPWARAVGITIFINSILGLLSYVRVTTEHHVGNTTNSGGNLIGVIISFYLGAKLLGYAKKIGDLLKTGSATDLAAALAEHRKYWKTNGVLMLIIMVFVVIGLLAFAGAAPH
jgi:hypothetical protein